MRRQMPRELRGKYRLVCTPLVCVNVSGNDFIYGGMDMSEKRVALVSGAATGIGRDCSVQLAKDGFQMVLCDWNKEEGEKTLALCREQNVEADFLEINMAVEEQAEKFIRFAAEKYGKIDFYFNNQGVIHMPKLFEDITEEDFDYVTNNNFKACFFGMKHALRVMKKQGYGHLVNTGSSSGIRPETGFGVYSATKHAVIGLTKDAAIEMAKYGVRVNSVCPGGIITPLTIAVGKYMQEHQFVQPKASTALLGPARMGQTSEITGVISFLASEASSYMTGAIISVDGGNTQ